MSKPKFSRGETVTIPHKDSKPHLFSGVGVISNLIRVNGSWSYEVTFHGGRKEEVEEKRIEKRIETNVVASSAGLVRRK